MIDDPMAEPWEAELIASIEADDLRSASEKALMVPIALDFTRWAVAERRADVVAGRMENADMCDAAWAAAAWILVQIGENLRLPDNAAKEHYVRAALESIGNEVLDILRRDGEIATVLREDAISVRPQ